MFVVILTGVPVQPELIVNAGSENVIFVISSASKPVFQIEILTLFFETFAYTLPKSIVGGVPVTSV